MPQLPDLVLFDRDGTLVHDFPYNGDPDWVRPVPGAEEALDRLRARGIRVGVVTNQSGVARGLITMAQVDACMARLTELLGPVRHHPGLSARSRRRLHLPQARARHGDDGLRRARRGPGAVRRHRRRRLRRRGRGGRGCGRDPGADAGHPEVRGRGGPARARRRWRTPSTPSWRGTGESAALAEGVEEHRLQVVLVDGGVGRPAGGLARSAAERAEVGVGAERRSPMTFTGRDSSASASSVRTSASSPMVPSSSSLPSVTMTTLLTGGRVVVGPCGADRGQRRVVEPGAARARAGRGSSRAARRARRAAAARPRRRRASRVGTSSTQSVAPSSCAGERPTGRSPRRPGRGSARSWRRPGRGWRGCRRRPRRLHRRRDVERPRAAATAWPGWTAGRTAPAPRPGPAAAAPAPACRMPVASPAPGGASPSMPRKPACRTRSCGSGRRSAAWTTASTASASAPDGAPDAQHRVVEVGRALARVDGDDLRVLGAGVGREDLLLADRNERRLGVAPRGAGERVGRETA